MTEHENRAKAFREKVAIYTQGLPHATILYSKELFVDLLAELSWLEKNSPPYENRASDDFRARDCTKGWGEALASVRALLEEPKGGK